MTATDLGGAGYVESGSGWSPLTWGPAFALLGLLVELGLPGPVHLPQWLGAAALFAAATAVWVAARRKYRSVLLTPERLVVGGETVPVERIEALGETEDAWTGRVLGGQLTLPRGTGAVPLLLSSGEPGSAQRRERVLAWARDPEALRTALGKPPGPPE
ncbi:hypothetical protein FHR84_002018 [Actinopolyspora biskrensis]|uniref:DUF3093 domain-containing protein n=1 Tax=Actinopolyspora biskrensis TaxID=1470178 RepID=A0A852Z9C7_9ACTN|nr:hypothetical protein [Actinopolyspora biskrensis]NYH78693.1 hypothetical protein [Actinopolyspora biskrensis]